MEKELADRLLPHFSREGFEVVEELKPNSVGVCVVGRKFLENYILKETDVPRSEIYEGARAALGILYDNYPGLKIVMVDDRQDLGVHHYVLDNNHESTVGAAFTILNNIEVVVKQINAYANNAPSRTGPTGTVSFGAAKGIKMPWEE